MVTRNVNGYGDDMYYNGYIITVRYNEYYVKCAEYR
jgi:hypothetical protein